MNCYPNLFQEGKIGRLTLKNRLVMPALEVLAGGFNGEISDDLIAFYEKRAKAGVGLIITAYASVDDEYCQSFEGAQLKLTHPKHTSAMSRLARTIHKYETKIMVQIYMAGRQAVPSSITGKRMIAPSPIGYSLHDQIPEEMTRDEIKKAVQKFGKAAKILQDAMIDGVEILAAGGYMINQFLSPYSNQRTDDYGGSFENRMRFLLEVIAEVRRVCGPHFPISVRFSADEFTEGGYGLDEGVRIAMACEAAGVDCLNVNNGNQECRYTIIEPTTFKTGWKSYITKAIKEAVSIPVISTNVIKKPEQAEQFLADGIMDFAAVGRGMFADGDWARKAYEGRAEDIKPCIGCLYCLDQTAFFRSSTCAVNGTSAREREFPPLHTDLAGKTVVIVGAGPSGMEAALVCKQRGANIIVFEKSNCIGGAALLGTRTPDKEALHALIEYYEVQAKKAELDIRFGTEATPELIQSYDPYAIFVGVGATPIIPAVEGIKDTPYLTIPQALSPDYRISGQRVVVIGGGMTGCETAEHFAMMGNQVTLVEMQHKLAPEVSPDNLVTVLQHLQERNAQILLSHKLIRLQPNMVTVCDIAHEQNKDLPADVVILSLGNRSDRTLYDKLKQVCKKVYAIGDTLQVGRIANAVHTGFERAYTLE
ncbi:FAD-dependent oxidoreductase [Agathobaculum sp. TL06]